MTDLDIPAFLPILLKAADAASSRIVADFGDNLTVLRKGDGSPVTQTDRDAEAIITRRLRDFCDVAIVAEEEFEAGHTKPIDVNQPFFLIDALDGTREFIKGQPDFTVNIALIVGRVPVLGVIAAPAFQKTWYGVLGQGAFCIEGGCTREISARTPVSSGLSVLGGKTVKSQSVLEEFIGGQLVDARTQRSSSLKFCLIAEGSADVYPRMGETYEWDTAAGDAILREAGGVVLDIQTRMPLTYGKQDARFLNGGFVAGSRAVLQRYL